MGWHYRLMCQYYFAIIMYLCINHGVFFTPKTIVNLLLDIKFVQPLLPSTKQPLTVLEPGCGTGSFIVEVVRCFPNVQITGVEQNPSQLDDFVTNITIVTL